MHTLEEVIRSPNEVLNRLKQVHVRDNGSLPNTKGFADRSRATLPKPPFDRLADWNGAMPQSLKYKGRPGSLGCHDNRDRRPIAAR